MAKASMDVQNLEPEGEEPQWFIGELWEDARIHGAWNQLIWMQGPRPSALRTCLAHLPYSEWAWNIADDFDAGGDKLVIIMESYPRFPRHHEQQGHILRHLILGGIVRLFCVSGAQGQIDMTLMALFPDAEIRDQVVNEFIEKGLFTGIEFAAITSGRYQDILVWGVDENDTFNYLKRHYAQFLKISYDDKLLQKFSREAWKLHTEFLWANEERACVLARKAVEAMDLQQASITVLIAEPSVIPRIKEWFRRKSVSYSEIASSLAEPLLSDAEERKNYLLAMEGKGEKLLGKAHSGVQTSTGIH